MHSPLRISINELQTQYEAVSALGRGNSGSVYVYRNRQDGGEVALKIVKTTRNEKRTQALAEIQILRALQHQRIVKIFKYYDETFTAYTEQKRYEIGLLLERGLGSLQHYVKDRSYHYDFADILRFIVKFIELGAYLESQAIVHRDIKPGNIIIFDNNLQFKLGDFGLSCKALERPRGFAGTPAYCSPGLKKFYNEGDHRKFPNTNAFKDDVYSFALTSEEVIKHRFSLEECPKEITSLLDEMLRHDERDRPTFTHLLHHQTVQKYLKECVKERIEERQEEGGKVELQQGQIKIESFTKKKAAGGEFNELDHHTQKSRKVKEQQSLKCAKGIRTLCSINQQYLLAGTNEGLLYVVDRHSGQSTMLSLSHRNYVAKIVVDPNGDLWSAGGDGKVYFIERNELLRCIQCNKVTLPVKKKRFSILSSLKDPPFSHIIKIPEESIKVILENFDQQMICELLCLDVNHFAVGFCSGTVSVRWGEEPLRTYRIHSEPIIGLRISESILYSSDFGGNIKAYNLTKRIIDKAIYNFSPQLLDFSVIVTQGGRNIEGISSNGQLQIINFFKSSRTTFNAELPAKNLVAAAFSSKQYYLLTSDGCLFFKNTPFLKLEGNHWACLVQINENQLMVGSHSGEICIIMFE